MSIDIDATRQQVERYTGFAGSSQSFLAHQLAKKVPVLLAKVDELTAERDAFGIAAEQNASELDMVGTLARQAIARLNAERESARTAAARLLRMEREHTGTGREGHLSETDLRPLLHALGIDTEEQP